MEKVDIIIVSYNAIEFLKKCINSVKLYSADAKIIIVDNKSNQSSIDYLKSIQCDTIKVIYNNKNYGFGHANNQALEISNAEYICFLNSDTIVTENWLSNMIHVLQEQKVAFVGPTSNVISSDQQKVKFKYFQPLDSDDDSKIQEFSKQQFDKNKFEVLQTRRLVGFCILTKREYLDKIGNFDERYGIGNFEDDDLCLRAIERGYKMCCAKGVFIYHYGGKSFKEEYDDPTPTELLEKNQKIHELKWYKSKRIDKANEIKNPLKIIYLMASDGPSGGVKVIFEQANRLRARGHDVKIHCGVKESKPWFPVKVPIIYSLTNIPDCDILIGTYFSTLPFLQLVNAKVKLHLCQGYEAQLYSDISMLSTIKNNYRITKEKIVVSNWLKKIIDEEYGINCHYISNGLDQNVFSFEKHKRNEKVRVLVTGNDGLEIKGIRFALAAIRDLVESKKIELVRLSGSVRSETNLDCEFHLMTQMTQDEIAKVYGSCDITINASKKVEGFSLPPLESMASGTPVITSDCGGVMDYAVDGFNALVVHAENSQAIREKLDLLLKDEKLYDRLADQGIKTSKQYVWYNQIDKLEKLFYDLYFESLKKETESLSVCMIVKNEQEYLQQCLESIKTIANEIIIVDTGSTDETIQIAKRFGVKLYHFEWNDDFSAARNFALSKATQKWTLILDADERIASKDLLKLREMLQGDNFAYNFETRNYVTDRNIEGVRACDGRYKEDKDFVGWCWSVKIRLFQTNKQIQFVGKVHELVEESINVPVKNAQIQILHFGYLKNRQNKDNLYLRLGIEKLKNKKDDVKAIFELATQYMALNDYDEALVLWRKALEIEPGNVDFLSKIGTTYNLLENYASAEKYFKKSLQIKETEYAYRHLGITYAKLNDYQKSYDCFRKIIHVTKDLKAFGDYAYCCNVLRKFDETILIVEPLMKKYRSIVQPWGLLDIAYNEKAIEFARTRKFQQALLFLRQAIALNPNFEAAQRNLKEVVRVMNLTGSTK